MNFRAVRESEWRVLQTSAEASTAIKSRATRLVERLAHAFNDKTTGGVSGLKFIPTFDANHIADVESEYGNARLKLHWRVNSEQVSGELRLERVVMDSRDRATWEPVFSVQVPRQGGLHVGFGLGAFHISDDTQSTKGANDLFELAMSMLYSIVKGPVTE